MVKSFIFFIIYFTLTISSDSYSQYAIREAFPNLTFAYPIELVHSTDTASNKLYLVEKAGRIIVFDNNANVTSTKVMLDITDRVATYFYAGLFGIAFHPEYTTNRYFYLYYLSGNGASLTLNLSRFETSTTNPDSALKSSEFILLSTPAPSSNHNGSSIRFGPDGYLYFGYGDSSPGSGGDPLNKAQNRAELFGKMHRINVDSVSGGRNYSIPPTNPYYQNTSGYREEIFAYGFRNMWKFAFDDIGRIWLADVGQARFEEVNIVESGKNYGWRRKEGTVCFNPSSNCDTIGFLPTDPLYAYSHSFGSSITGGYVYSGNSMPGLKGKYIYSDYTSGRIWALSWDGINPPTNTELFDTPYGIVSFGEDKFKNLYFLHFTATAGKIYKIVDSTLTSVYNSEIINPSGYMLGQNYPNPFNPVTHLEFGISDLGFVSLKVYDILGNEIATLINEKKDAGSYEVEFDGKDLPSGIYFYSLNVDGNISDTKRMVLLK